MDAIELDLYFVQQFRFSIPQTFEQVRTLQAANGAKKKNCSLPRSRSFRLSSANKITSLPKGPFSMPCQSLLVEGDLEIEPSNGLESKSRPLCATGGNTDFPINIYDTTGQQLQPLCKVE